jgi:NADPH:quinone reductase-like Zn-dependent oxidoreductase/acyl carrier protein
MTQRLYIVTCATQQIAGERHVGVAQAPLWGMGRSLIHEDQDLSTVMVDLDSEGSADGVAQVFTEIQGEPGHEQVAWRNGERWVAHLVRHEDKEEAMASGAALARLAHRAPNFRLEIAQTEAEDGLTFRATERPIPGEGQVEIEVTAAGLNFSDVMKWLGLYPGIQDDVVPLGIECSGRISALGQGVAGFKVGDEVIALAPYCFARYIVAPEYGIAKKPDGIALGQAAAIPVAFLTAWYALQTLGRISAGERVLIHAAAGGVGQAAIQIAKNAGATVFATAGTEEKREFLRSLGVDQVFDSRTLAFSDEIQRATAGEGVDLVLNSLAGDAMVKSLGLLRPYGRFLELGKTDIYTNRMVGLEPFRKNLSYFAIDLDRIFRDRPAIVRTVLADVMSEFASGRLTAMPQTTFALRQVSSAFRFMAQRKNIGKVVVEVASAVEAARQDAAETVDRPTVGGGGTYLISGGLGSLGLQVAEWLAAQGARYIALMGRHEPSDRATERLEALRERGAEVETFQCDVGVETDLLQALEVIRANMPPLRGVVHAAGVLGDAVFFQTDWARCERVFQPKVAGAWNLHRATLGSSLDWFVMFSSAASLLGSSAQGTYAAANAFLDALAHHRRAMGLPGLAINWGPWQGTGMAADEVRQKELRGRGAHAMPPDKALEALGVLLRKAPGNIGVMSVDWPKAVEHFRHGPPRAIRKLLRDGEGIQGHGLDQELVTKLAGTTREEAAALLLPFFVERLSRIMAQDPSEIDVEEPLSNLGIDSLMAFELKGNIDTRLGIQLPMNVLLERPSLKELSLKVVDLVESYRTLEAAS